MGRGGGGDGGDGRGKLEEKLEEGVWKLRAIQTKKG